MSFFGCKKSYADIIKLNQVTILYLKFKFEMKYEFISLIVHKRYFFLVFLLSGICFGFSFRLVFIFDFLG